MRGDHDHTLDGLVLGEKYELVRRIGAGGMGEVFRGKQLSTGGRVAVKIMDARDRPAKTLARFKYEAETTAQLTHPNTVRILDFGTDKDLLFLVMEYLSGTDLTRFLRPGGQSDPFVAHVLFQVASSLTEAHSRGVIHRDIKPNNIMLLQHVGHPSFVKVIDFGIARAIAGPGHGTRGILGTIGYIAPEAVHDQAQPDTRTDLYSLGCVAYELVTGRLPFDGITHQSAPLDVLEAHMSGTPRHVLDVKPSVDEELAEIVMSLIARDPQERPVTAGDVVLPLHAIRSRVSEGVVFSVDIPPASKISADAERDHADVVHLESEALTSMPPQAVTPSTAKLDAVPGAPTVPESPSALNRSADTASGSIDIVQHALLTPGNSADQGPRVYGGVTTEEDTLERDLGGSNHRQLASPTLIDQQERPGPHEGLLVNPRSTTDDAIPAGALLAGDVDADHSVDPRGCTDEAVPAKHLPRKQDRPESPWQWSEDVPAAMASSNEIKESSKEGTVLPTLVLFVALMGILAWFLVGR